MATAVPQERDAVARAFPATDRPRQVRLPGAQLHRMVVGTTDVHRVVAATTDAAAPAATCFDLLAAGVGPARAAAATATALTAATLAGEPYDLVVSTGIGGGFAPGAPVGALVVADRITVADLGAEAPGSADGFLPVTALGFGTVTHHCPESLAGALAAALDCVTGEVLTVSTVTGSAARTAELRARHPRAVAEAMEGFGVAEAAAAHGCPVLEVRAVSNPVGPRDREAWRLGEAFAALTAGFRKFPQVLESWQGEGSEA
ncbi:futalosine hydrolase [Streptomyces sp. NA04227]|nr:futalosine hydrolase [Streptomyces sp. NA04227]